MMAADDRTGWRVARAALVATMLVVTAVWLLPLIAFVTGAYSSMPATFANALRLLAYLTPVALPVAIPIGLAIGVLAACGDRSTANRARSAVAVLAIAATILASALLVWIAPSASQAFRDLAAPQGIASRVNTPGSIGDRLLRDEGWAILCGTGVLAAFALCAAGAARGRVDVRIAAAAASCGWMALYWPANALALTRTLPIALAAWLPNLVYATAAIIVVLIGSYVSATPSSAGARP